MKKSRRSIVVALVIAVSLIMTLTASAAASSTGIVEVDCTVVHSWGTVAEGEQVRLWIRLHDAADHTSPILQEQQLFYYRSG